MRIRDFDSTGPDDDAVPARFQSSYATSGEAPILARLQGLRKVRPGRNGWTNACCPAHDDRTPSFGWVVDRAGRSGSIASPGRSQGALLSALQCKVRDLFPVSDNGSWLRSQTWAYRGFDGEVYRKTRFDRADGGKGFHAPGFKYNDIPPLGWDSLVDDKAVIAVEGERVRDALLGVGFANVIALPSSSYHPEERLLSFLDARMVMLWPDDDEAGQPDAPHCRAPRGAGDGQVHRALPARCDQARCQRLAR